MTDDRRAVKTSNVGTGISEERERVDFADLRRRRTDRVFSWMETEGLDALVLGREANVRYLTGARRLWTSLSRGFAPTCIAVRSTRSIQMLSFSASYEGIPPELAPDDIFAVTWNPMNLADHVHAVPGAGDARRVGVDGLNGLFDGLLQTVLPGAELVGIQPGLTDLRRVKLDGEVECLRIAAATAESSLMAAVGALRPGRTGKELQAAYLARMCELGTSTFAQQGTFTTWRADGSFDFDTTTETLAGGVPVALAGGVLWSGYEGSLARTWWTGRDQPPAQGRSRHDRYADILSAVSDAARPGGSGAAVLEALQGGGADPTHSAVYFVGMGHEGPLAAAWLDRAALERQQVVTPAVLAVRVLLPGSDGGPGYLAEDMVLVGPSGTERLTTLGYGPLAG